MINSTVEADFDRLALLDDQGWTVNNHYHPLLLRYVPQGCEKALEVGCGTGSFARQLAARCKRVVAIDLSAEMIRVARERASQTENLKPKQVGKVEFQSADVEFQLADVMTWEFPRGQFDFICSIATMHHLPQRELLPKMRDALRPGGVLVVLDLVKSETLRERMLDVAAMGVSVSLRLIHNGRLQPPPEVRKAWEQHGKQDHYSTLKEIRALADEILPGASVIRCLLWRYLLVYKNKGAELS